MLTLLVPFLYRSLPLLCIRLPYHEEHGVEIQGCARCASKERFDNWEEAVT